MKYIVFVIVLLLSGCSLKDVQKTEVADFSTIPQSPDYYTKNMVDEYIKSDNFEQKYFRIWQQEIKDSVDEIKWGFTSYTPKNSYAENLKVYDDEFFQTMLKEANFDDYMSLNKRAILKDNSSLRVFPTYRMLFKNPALAGEGFPFDYMQNSAIYAFEPVVVSHYSKTKEWVFVFSSFASGWVKSKDILFLDDKACDDIKESKKIFILKDNVAIYDDRANFLFKTRLGMLLSLASEDDTNFFVRYYKMDDDNLVELNIKVPKSIATKEPLELNAKNIEAVYSEVYKNIYGWGGSFDQRDCSSMLRDIFMPFGVWLPRNSLAQSRVGEVISLSGMQKAKKIEMIKKYAIPFKTLLYRKGHIVLYVGTFDDEIVVFHNTWGVRTKNIFGEYGRFVVGRAIFSTLSIGSEVKDYDKNGGLLENIVSMNILKN